MRAIIVTLTLAAALVAGFAGCAKQVMFKPPLLFYNPSDKSDVSDFVHLQFDNAPLSFEVLGTNVWESDTICVVMIQIGTYGSPKFVAEYLDLEPDSVTFHVNGKTIQRVFAYGGDTNGKPWEWLTIHHFGLNSSRVLSANDSAEYISIKISLDGYARYNGQRIDLDTVTAVVRREM